MAGAVLGLCMLCTLWFSDAAMAAALGAAQTFVRAVLPALLPMMVLSRLCPGGTKNERFFLTAVKTAAFACLGGSPAGAQRVRALWETDARVRRHIAPLLSATGVMSPMFFTGTLAAMTGLRAACWAMLGCHWLGAGLTAWAVWRWEGRRRGTNASGQAAGGSAKARGAGGADPRRAAKGSAWLFATTAKPLATDSRQPKRAEATAVASATIEVAGKGRSPSSAPFPRPSLLCALPDAVSGASQALLAVCGAMMTFATVAGVLRAAAQAAFPAFVAAHARAFSVLWGLLEIGGGAAAVLGAWDAPPMALLSALCAFGGLSIWLQNLLFVSPCIRPAKLLLIRALHGALSMGLYAGVATLLPGLHAGAQGAAVTAMAGGSPAGAPIVALGLIWLAFRRPWRAF